MTVCYVVSLESPQWGDSNEYTQHTIFNIKKKKNTHNYPKSAAMGYFKGLKNEFETAVVDEPSVFEPPKFYCNSGLAFDTCLFWIVDNLTTTKNCTVTLRPGDWDPSKNQAVVKFDVLAQRSILYKDKNLVLHFTKINSWDAPPIFNNYQIPSLPVCNTLYGNNYRTSVAKTLMAHLPRLFRLCSWVPWKYPIAAFGIIFCDFLLLFFFDIEMVHCVYSLESPHLVDSNENTQNTFRFEKIEKMIIHIMPPNLALWLTLIISNYPYLEHIFMVPKLLEPLKLSCCQTAISFTL